VNEITLTINDRQVEASEGMTVLEAAKEAGIYIPANVLTNPALDPVAKIPELKVCAVRVEKNGHK